MMSANESALMAEAGPAPRSLAQGADEAWPTYAADEIEAVAELLRSGRVNQWTGDTVFAFERALTERFGGGNGVVLANGSVALELALRAFGIGPGDEVIVTPRTFVASAYCAMLVGATPVFADVDPESGNITAETIAAVITERTKAIIPVHLAGWPADMPAIMALAGPRGIKVIEDCAQAVGAEIDGRSIGSFGDAAAFSFCQDKIVSTAGEGGFTSFQDPIAYEWAWSFKDHGKTRSAATAKAERPGFRWLHDGVGTNWRMPGPQAAVGLIQLRKLDGWIETRTRNAMIWTQALRRVPGLSVPLPRDGIRHAFYKLHFYLDPVPGVEALRDELLQRAPEMGLKLFSGTCSEVYREHGFDGLPRPHCPTARSLGERSLMVEVHPTLDPERLERRADALADLIASVTA